MNDDQKFRVGDLVLIPPDGSHGEQPCKVVRITTNSIKLACQPVPDAKRRTVLVSPQSEIRILRRRPRKRRR